MSTKELFVSSTPHETKVGLVEDDLLAEIYLERENEYTLAGSIYKGRVTRVLPGMQSAFVDIGLERDAFLYVSDFMELEEGDEVDDIPTNRAVNGGSSSSDRERNGSDQRPRLARADALPTNGESHDVSTPSSHEHGHDTAEHDSRDENGLSAESPESGMAEPGNRVEALQNDDRGGYRGRRRRRGRRGERDNAPEPRLARPVETPVEAAVPPERAQRSDRGRAERKDFGPPPGYQPIILPGESISKYARMASAPVTRSSQQVMSSPSAGESGAPLAEKFPDDEPLFAASQPVPSVTAERHVIAETHETQQFAPLAEGQPAATSNGETDPDAWDREQKRLHALNVAAVFGTDNAVNEADSEEDEEKAELRPVASTSGSAAAAPARAMAVEEEEIDEDEADLAHYVEELEEDEVFIEMEEVTSDAGHDDDDEANADHDIAAFAGSEPDAASSHDHPEPFSSNEALAFEEGDHLATERVAEQEEQEAEELEIDEAQAEAEAILDAEARGDGTVDARVEVRAPSPTAAYTQRTQRQGFDHRRGGQRGRRSSGGRRFQNRTPQNVPLISDLLKEGQEILVQIAKEPIGKKGARITSHIALPGRFLVYMPTVNHTGVSRKISSEEERQRLKRIIISERENGQGGFIVRTAAQGADEEELRADIRFLKGLWNEIKTRAENGKGPTLIYHDLNVVERILRDQVTSDFSTVWVDNEQEYERVLRFANRFQPALVRKVKFYSKEVPLFEQFGLSEEINKALKSKVWLKSGGYIVINQTEALVAIDVNTGKYVGKTARLEDTIVKTNVDAIKEIVRQIRLRDLGGIIIIDFIDMDERRNRQRVMQALEEALRSDRAPSKVLQFNDFGLVAITRKRVKQSLERTIGSPCPYCESTGYVKSVPTICNDIYIEMRKMAKHLDHADVMLRVNPEVAKVLKANNGKALLEMEELTKKSIIVKSDPALHQEQFDIN